VNTYSLGHLSDGTLLRDLTALVSRDRATTAELLAHLAEVDARKLYLGAAFPTMHDWCVRELHMSEASAYKRVRAAQAAHRFPVIFEAVADGRLHLSAVVMLKPHLTEETVAELVAAATHKSKVEIEHLIAQRFPRRDLPSSIQPLAPGPMELTTLETLCQPGTQEASSVPAPSPERARVKELAPERFGLQVTISQNTHDKLRYAEELLSHRASSRELAQVLDLALEALIERLEKGRLGSSSRPRRGRGLKTDGRYIPVAVKRAVWQRDQGQCTFVSESGQRCPAKERIEFDHIETFANGGLATAGNLRLRCKPHNQYCAELEFGAEFMRQKCDSARRAAAMRRETAAAKPAELAQVNHAERATAMHAGAEEPGDREAAASPMEIAAARPDTNTQPVAIDRAEDRDVIPWLRALGFRPDEARHAAEACAHIPDASLEQRVKVALASRARSRPRAA
jgi:hypothetical protein